MITMSHGMASGHSAAWIFHQRRVALRAVFQRVVEPDNRQRLPRQDVALTAVEEMRLLTDIAYVGNVYVPEWTGCPDDVLKKLGVS